MKTKGKRKGKRFTKARKKQSLGKNGTVEVSVSVYESCIETSIMMMRMWKDLITNFPHFFFTF